MFEYFTEVKSTGGFWQRVLPWKRVIKHDPHVARTTAEPHSPIQQASFALCNFGIIVGGYVSGVLGGMAVMTLLHLNLFNTNTPPGRSDLALYYYAPIALAVNRTYWGLISIAISSSISRSFIPMGCLMAHVDARERHDRRGFACADHLGFLLSFQRQAQLIHITTACWSRSAQQHGAPSLLVATSLRSLQTLHTPLWTLRLIMRLVATLTSIRFRCPRNSWPVSKHGESLIQ